MSAVANLRAGLVEVFSLRAAERTVTGYGADRLERIRGYKRDAARRLRASRRLARPSDALSLLDEALRLGLRALHEVRAPGEPFDPLAELDARGAGSLDAASAARSLLSGEVPEDFGARDLQRELVDLCAAEILRAVESRTRLELAALRWGRVLALALAFVWVAGSLVHEHWMVHNVALHKRVITSSLKYNPPAPSELVDGRDHVPFNVHTNDGRPAFVMVDLARTYDVRRVRVVNRDDGWFDDVLPLELSVSLDGIHFDPIATRTTHFDVWDTDLGGRPARYVRLTRDRGYIALDKLEVYARE
jgi:hypothetical protein